MIPKLNTLTDEDSPRVGVLIPTCGEPVWMVIKTIESVITQNYPRKKLVVVVGDDMHNPILEKEVKLLKRKTHSLLFYHHPPVKGDERRKGEAKSGNLNSALQFVSQRFPDINFIETRDADDLVGDKNFLRYCLHALLEDPITAFVQTIKRVIVSPGDPFSNQEEIFYERTMLFRAADNAVFPCGSGLVWRKTDLEKINNFPTWNLVEDLQSGYEILKHKRRGIYLPVIGALGQIAPQDIPNYYKQRGTWAIDTTRLFFWYNPFFTRGLNLKQRLQFLEHFSNYLLAFPLIFFIFGTSICVNEDLCPIQNLPPAFIILNLAYIFVFELFSFTRANGLPYFTVWKTRQSWIGLSPVYLVACLKALFYGPLKKPKYKVTRKKHQYSFYWFEVLPQAISFLILAVAIFLRITGQKSFVPTDLILLYWASFLMYGYHRVILNSWYGKSLKQILNRNKEWSLQSSQIEPAKTT